jgi:hypothetical protein
MSTVYEYNECSGRARLLELQHSYYSTAMTTLLLIRYTLYYDKASMRITSMRITSIRRRAPYYDSGVSDLVVKGVTLKGATSVMRLVRHCTHTLHSYTALIHCTHTLHSF